MFGKTNLNKENLSFKLLVFSVLLLFSCSDRIPLTYRINSKEQLPTISIENVEDTYTEDGRVKLKLMAPLAETYEGIVEPYVDFKKGITIIMYDKDNKIEKSMTADKAVYYNSKKTWEATGNVIVTNINGDIFRTEKLYGDEKEQKIFTNKLVKITQSNGTIFFAKSGFESNSNFTIYKFIAVSGDLYLKEEFLKNTGSTETTSDPGK